MNMIVFIKKIVKRIIKKLFPYLIRKFHEIEETRSEVRETRSEVKDINNILNLLTDSDFQFFKLRKMLNEIEYYQPAYMIGGIDLVPKRECKDRCRAIEKSLNCSVAGLRMLDIGASLGYVCYYFADRGAVTYGWEINPKNAEVANLIGRINGIPSTIRTKEASIESIKEIKPGEYDIIILLSVLHHIVHFKGLEYVQELVKELYNKVSTLIVELAVKDEDTALYWNESQPENELAVFDMVRDDIEISKIGEFKTHLSLKARPIFMISEKEKKIIINGKIYSYDKKTNLAYDSSLFPYEYPGLRRYYYFSHAYIIKEYIFTEKNNENAKQIIVEMGNMFSLQGITKVKITTLIDFEIREQSAFIVIARDDGELLSDILDKKEINPEKVLHDVLEFLAVLEEYNIHHNDIRSWNILWDGGHAQVIDYGIMSHIVKDDDIVSLLWVLDAILTKCKERSLQARSKSLPPKSHFYVPRLQGMYEIIEEGERSPKKLLDYLSEEMRSFIFKSLTKKHIVFREDITYLITLSEKHFIPAVYLISSFIEFGKKDNIVVIGNLRDTKMLDTIKNMGVQYLDEDAIDYGIRMPKFNWKEGEKLREPGWFKQQFIRLSADLFVKTPYALILDSEVFPFLNWDEKKLFEGSAPRYLYWIPEKRKPEWDYKMYVASAMFLCNLPEFGNNVIEYANSDIYLRHVCGIQLFSMKNLAYLWKRLEQETDLEKNMYDLINRHPELLFSEYEIYGLAVEYGFFDKQDKTIPYNNLLGWYDNHTEENFQCFRKDAMWSMCQRYMQFNNDSESYYRYMKSIANELNQKLALNKAVKIDVLEFT
jgi:O-antigen chain-terminating methyltransferase